MDTEPNEGYLATPGDLSEEFFRMVVGSVEFGEFAPDDTTLYDRVVRLTARGQSADALGIVRRNSGLGEKEAQELISRIESAADRVFYATGLRPSIRPLANERL